MMLKNKFMIAILAALLVGSNGYWVWKDREQYRVTSVYDGDTFWIKAGDRVRLLGAGAPEEGRCLADKAKEKLEELVSGRVVKLTEEKRDEWGRRMGLVYVDGILVNAEMLRLGLARPDYTKNSQNEVLKTAFHEATENKRGIHSSECRKTGESKPSEPGCVIKGNIDPSTWDHFYHLPSCRHYKYIVLNTDLGESYFCSEKEAQEAGFHLAPDCLR